MLTIVALIVGLALDLVFGRDGRGLRGGETGAARFGQRAERDQLQAVTDLADLAIDLEAALQLAFVEFAERAGERPLLPRRLRCFVRLLIEFLAARSACLEPALAVRAMRCFIRLPSPTPDLLSWPE